MHKTLAGALLLAATLITPQLATAGVYMCVDPVSGKKTFTDKACPTLKAGTKVKVSGDDKDKYGRPLEKNWNSERDKSLTGRANLNETKRVAASISGNGLLGIGS